MGLKDFNSFECYIKFDGLVSGSLSLFSSLDILSSVGSVDISSSVGSARFK